MRLPARHLVLDANGDCQGVRDKPTLPSHWDIVENFDNKAALALLRALDISNLILQLSLR